MLLDGFLGALLGALITGAAQIWSFRKGRKDAQAAQSLNAARELLKAVYQSIQVMRLLPFFVGDPAAPRSVNPGIFPDGPGRRMTLATRRGDR